MKIERMRELLSGVEHNALEPWDRGFLESVLHHTNSHGTLSDRQLEVLSQVEKRYNTSALEEKLRWRGFFMTNEKVRESFSLMLSYYKKEGYYTAVVQRVAEHATKFGSAAPYGYIPPEKEYRSVCENKYAEKILEAHFSKPVFQQGDIVQFRRTAKSLKEFYIENNNCYFNPATDTLAVVLEVNALPVRHAKKGSKVYKVLPFGSARQYYILEANIKKHRSIRK